MANPPPEWTPAEVAILRAGWPTKSAREIALQLPGRSKNSVVAKAHRLGLEEKPSPILPKPAHPSRPSAQEVRAEVIRLALARPPEDDGEEIEPIEPPPPPDTGCLWPTEPCEAPRLRGKPYCEAHCRLAYRSIDSAGKVRRWVPGEERS